VPADRRSANATAPRPGRRRSPTGPIVLATSAQLAGLDTGCAVAVAGLVIARQRPGTAKGTMFLLFEDEWGTVNLVVNRAVYERHRQLARAEPLLLARGRLERSEGVVNVIVRELAALEGFLSGGVEGSEDPASTARVHRLPAAERPQASEEQADDVGSSMRAVAPPVQSFAMGRRREEPAALAPWRGARARTPGELKTPNPANHSIPILGNKTMQRSLPELGCARHAQAILQALGLSGGVVFDPPWPGCVWRWQRQQLRLKQFWLKQFWLQQFRQQRQLRHRRSRRAGGLEPDHQICGQPLDVHAGGRRLLRTLGPPNDPRGPRLRPSRLRRVRHPSGSGGGERPAQ